MKKGKRILGAVLASAMLFSILPVHALADSPSNGEEDANWAELRAILSGITGTDTEAPELIGSNLFTNGMLLGNGSIGVVSDAQQGEQSFYVSSADGYNSNQKITNAQLQITGENQKNIPSVTTNDQSSNSSDKNMGPASVLDGDPLTYWVSNPTSRISGPKWLAFTFSRPITIDSWSSIHRGYMDTGAGFNNPRYNTRDFCLQVSENGQDWKTVDDIVANETHIVDRTLENPVTSQYFRVYITKPVQPGQETYQVTGDRETARISEVDFLYQGKSVIHPEETEEEQTFAYAQSDGNGFNGSAAGAFDGNPYTFWRSNNQMQERVDTAKPPMDKTIAVTSNQTFSFNELEILHFGSRYPDEPQYNTYDYQIQVQQNGEWVTLETISGNTENVNRFAFDETVSATGVRLYITKPVHPDYATKYQTDDMTFAMIYDINVRLDGKDVLHPDRKENGTYLHEQDILNAEVRSKQIISGEQFYFTSWVDAEKNLLYTDVTLDENASGDAKLYLQVKAPSGSSTSAGAKGDILYVTRAGGDGDYRFRVATALKVLNGDYQVKDGKGELTLNPGQTVRLITYSHTSAGTTQNGLPYKEANTLLQEASDYLNNADATSEQAVAQARQAGKDWWKEYWLKSYIDIDDKILQRYYYGALYGLGSTIRPTPEGAEQPNIPSAMMGVWQTGDNAGSGGRAYLNYNYEAPYYGLHSSNRSDLMEPYYDDVTKRLTYVQNSTAKNGYHGASIVRNILPVYPVYNLRTTRTEVAGTKKPTGSGFADQKTNTMLYTQALLWDWQYNKNQDRLVKYIYNTVRDAVLFYIDFVVYNEADGAYWIYNSASNERDGYGYDVNPNIDIGYIQSHFSSFIDLIEEASALGVTGLDTLADDKENLIPQMQNILDNLCEYPTNINNADTASDLKAKGFAYNKEIIMSAVSSNNGTQIKASNVPWGMYIYEGNQPVPLEGMIHPAENVSLASDANLLALVKDTFEYYNPMRPYYRGGGYNGFAKSYTMAARLGLDGEAIANNLRSTIESIWRENLTCMTNGHGIEVFGNVETINSMLLQNENDELRVFPAWEKSRDAKFVDLRAKNAFLVSSEYKADSGVSYVKLTSEKGNAVHLVAPWEGGIKVVDSNGAVVPTTISITENTAEFLYTFETKAGESYTITEEGVIPENTIQKVTLSVDTSVLAVGGTVQASFRIQPEGDALRAVTFSSSNTDVVSVNKDGVIYGRGPGNAVVTLESVLDPTIKASVEVKVIHVDAPQKSETKYNNDTSAASYIGGWTHHKNRPGAYNKDTHYSATIGDTCEFTFNGTGVEFYSEKFNNCGKFEVWLDGEYVDTYENYLDVPSAQRDVVSYSVSGLSFEEHTLKLVVAEAKYLHVDAFKVTADMGLDSLYEELSAIQELNSAAYTPASWSSYLSIWQTVCDTYHQMLQSGAHAENIKQLTAELKAARDQLTGQADKAFLTSLVEDCEALTQADYTPESWSAFQAVLTEVKKVLTNEDATQGQVNAAYNELLAARLALVEIIPANKTELNALIACAEKINTDNVRPGKAQALKDALAAAKAVSEQPDAAQDQVNAASDALLEAIVNLKDIVDKTDLNNLANTLSKLKAEDYTPESFAVLTQALADAEKINDDSSVAEVTAAYKGLQNAWHQLVRAPQVDKEGLKNAIKNANLIINSIDSFKPNSVVGLEEALEKAQAVYDNPNATADEVKKATQELTVANAKAQVKEDKEVLFKAIEKAEALNAADYTPESFADLTRALNAARLVAQDDNAGKEQVANAAQAVEAAIANLQRVGDGSGSSSKPADGSGNSSGTGSGNGTSATGDSGNLWRVGLMLLVSLLGAATSIIMRKRQKAE